MPYRPSSNNVAKRCEWDAGERAASADVAATSGYDGAGPAGAFFRFLVTEVSRLERARPGASCWLQPVHRGSQLPLASSSPKQSSRSLTSRALPRGPSGKASASRVAA